MYMTPQQALAQYYQQGRQGGLPQATVAPTFGGLSTTAAPAPGSPLSTVAPQVNALAQQMQANNQLQRQIGYNGAPMPVTQPMQPQGGPTIAGQQFGPNGQPLQGMNQAQQAMPMQPGAPVGMAGAAPPPMAGNAQQPMQQQPGMRQWGGGMGGGANRLAQYYMR